MNFKLGEFVRFVDENREGYITRIIDEQMVGVTGDDDFEIPVMISNITRVHGHIDNSKEIHDEKKIIADIINFKQKGISLAVISDPNKGSVVHFYLINETHCDLFLALNTEKEQKYTGEFSGIIKPETFTKIHSATLPELDLWPKYHFRILSYTQHNIKPTPAIISEQKFKAKDFSGSKKQVPLLSQQGWLIQLDNPEFKIDINKLKESFFEPTRKEEKKLIEKPSTEVDLHIEKLRDDYQFIDKSEILDIQLKAFQHNLEAAIAHEFYNIIFIHGLGNNTLRNQIHKIVSKHPQVKTFMDAQKQKFGYGATEVVFK